MMSPALRAIMPGRPALSPATVIYSQNIRFSCKLQSSDGPCMMSTVKSRVDISAASPAGPGGGGLNSEPRPGPAAAGAAARARQSRGQSRGGPVRPNLGKIRLLHRLSLNLYQASHTVCRSWRRRYTVPVYVHTETRCTL